MSESIPLLPVNNQPTLRQRFVSKTSRGYTRLPGYDVEAQKYHGLKNPRVGKVGGTAYGAGEHHLGIFHNQLASTAPSVAASLYDWLYPKPSQTTSQKLLVNDSYKLPNQGASGHTLPFSQNIGPGNSLGDPRSKADEIALGHDLHYQDAKSDQHIYEADKEAISHFVHEAITGDNPVSNLQAAIGAVGLGVKHGVEKVTGVLYGNPSSVSGKSWVGIQNLLISVAIGIK